MQKPTCQIEFVLEGCTIVDFVYPDYKSGDIFKTKHRHYGETFGRNLLFNYARQCFNYTHMPDYAKIDVILKFLKCEKCDECFSSINNIDKEWIFEKAYPCSCFMQDMDMSKDEMNLEIWWKFENIIFKNINKKIQQVEIKDLVCCVCDN